MVRRLIVLLISIVLPLTATSSGCKAQHDSSQSAAKQDSISLPQAQHAESDLDISKKSSALITILSDGEYYFGPDKIPQSDLGQKVSEKLKDQPSYYHIVYVKSGKDVKYETVLAVLDSVRKVGYDRIGLVVEKEGTKEPMIFEALLPEKLDSKEKEFVLPPIGLPLRIRSQEPRLPKPADDLPPTPAKSETMEVPHPEASPPPEGKKLPKKTKVETFLESLKEPPKEIDYGIRVSPLIDIKPMGVGLGQSVELNSRVMSLIKLGSVLKYLTIVIEEKAVAIMAPKDKSYGDVIAVMDMVRGAGANPVILVVDPEDFFMDIPPSPLPPQIEEESERTKMIRKSGSTLQGDAIRRIQPKYPPLAKAAGVGGQVVVEVTVDESGNVITARAISGHALLKGAAEQAAMGWKFRPTLLASGPVKVIGTLNFNFTP